ncbi:hypothetical protein BDW66DRAFT_65734 [Aspergillus desertorum]
MGQRHNRRRTRPRSRNSSVNKPPPPGAISLPANFLCASSYPYSLGCPENRLASVRHYRGLTWQPCEHLESDTTIMETEQYRLFGGEPGDDVDLCYRMLEYFGGLDYIDPISSPCRSDIIEESWRASWWCSVVLSPVDIKTRKKEKFRKDDSHTNLNLIRVPTTTNSPEAN